MLWFSTVYGWRNPNVLFLDRRPGNCYEFLINGSKWFLQIWETHINNRLMRDTNFGFPGKIYFWPLSLLWQYPKFVYFTSTSFPWGDLKKFKLKFRSAKFVLAPQNLSKKLEWFCSFKREKSPRKLRAKYCFAQFESLNLSLESF